jgi:hypothetical protein
MNQNQNQSQYKYEEENEENEFLASFSQNVNVVNVEKYESCSCSSNCLRNELTNLKNQVERMEEKLDAILQKMDTNIIKNCDKMGEHIDFVNNVYDTVKVPLHYISNKVQKMIGGSTNPTVSDYNASKNVIMNELGNSNDDEYLFTEHD